MNTEPSPSTAASGASPTAIPNPVAPLSQGSQATAFPDPGGIATNPSTASATNPVPEPLVPSPPAVENPGQPQQPCRFAPEWQGVLESLANRIDALHAGQSAMAERLGMLPKQIQTVALKLDGMSSAAGEVKYQRLLRQVVGVFELAEGASLAVDTGRRDVVKVLATQLWQVLDEAGVRRIPVTGRPEPKLHMPVGKERCDDPTLAGHISSCVRHGFELNGRVICAARVNLWEWVAPAESAVPAAAGDVAVPVPPASIEGNSVESKNPAVAPPTEMTQETIINSTSDKGSQ